VPNKTLLIIASAGDEVARYLSRVWEGAGARLLHPRDLSRPGWKYQPGQIEASVAVASDELISVREISGVYTRLASVSPDELMEIIPEDRPYVAQEMNAFLVAWLSALPCPVINRPAISCLSGPNWRPEQWVHAAAQAGIPVVPVRRRVCLSGTPAPVGPPAQTFTLTVVGKECFGSKDRFLRQCALRIARCAKVELLAVNFAGSGKNARFLSANLWPDLSAPDHAGVVLDRLTRESRSQLEFA
jgi:hypothetical protein